MLKRLFHFNLHRSYNPDILKEVPKFPPDWDKALPYEAIPGPRPLPIIGNAWRYFFGELKHTNDVADMHHSLKMKYGNVCAIRNLGPLRDMVIIYDTDNIEIMCRSEGPYPVREGYNSLQNYRHELRKNIFGTTGSLLHTHGADWQKIRSVVSPVLMNPQVVEQFIPAVNGVASDFVNRVRTLARQNRYGEMPANFDYELNSWAFESISAIALAKRFGCLDESPSAEAKKMVRYMVELLNMMLTLDFNPMGPFIIKYNLSKWRKYVKYQDYFTDLALQYINETEKKIESNESNHSAFEKILKVDKRVAMVMTLDMLQAGIDTTGKVSAAILYFLAKNKRVQDILRKEIRNLMPQKDSPVTKAVLREARYLKAVVRETLRLSPIGSSHIRMTTNNVVLNGYQVPAGVTALFPNLYLCTRSNLFKKQDQFLPERYLREENSELSYKHISKYASFPFGIGIRSCVGQRLANLEMESMISKIIRNFEMDWPHKDLDFRQEFLYGIKGELKIHFKELQD